MDRINEDRPPPGRARSSSESHTTAEPELLLGVDSVSKSYGGAPALVEVSTGFRAGEVHAVVGENGAGKSTLVKIVSGIIAADSGRLFGPAHDDGDVAMVFQELSVVPEMSVFDNLALATRKRRGIVIPFRSIRKRAGDVLEKAGLGGLPLDLPVEALSLAQRQLLEIARGLIAEARVLILDEPTATLSDVEIQKIHGIIRSLTRGGTSIAYITHRLGEVFELADRVTIMRAGRVVATGPTAEFTMKSVVDQMLGSEHVPVEKVGSARAHDDPRSLRVDLATVRGVFADVSFEARGGEVLALFGQIGSGAGDVARSLAGLSELSTGGVALDGTDLRLRDRVSAQREKIAYISPDRVHEGVFLDASVATNISAGALGRVSSAGVISGRRELDLARSTAESVALDPRRIREPVSAFSGGNQQKVAVGRALATEPQVLVLNEPTRGVDIGARSEIYRSIRALSAQNVVVVVYSSDVLEIRELADRVVTMYRGRMVGEHEVDRVTDSDLLTEILSGEPT
ncbi:sugar ABC transporter ATP-binding protein [Herbiconiux sp. YIM B11900]|uniref:sugar ABC transporter ATP-binding protein n=1 Tax=Herbiconiux sp. YIM B11900 TaxID=3404131 RepID=UPI003F84D759